MSTFVGAFLTTLNDRWQELDILLNQARVARSNQNFELEETLCRASCILLVSHMEGFVKELVKAVVDDLNRNLSFHELPLKFQLAACSTYFPHDLKNSAHYINMLKSDLSNSSDFKIKEAAFVSHDKNPKASLIQKTLKKFGIEDIFKNLHQSIFEPAFESSRKAQRLLERMRLVTENRVKNFPYTAKSTRLKLTPKDYSGKTLWQEFLEDTNLVRNNIVHGHIFNIDRSVEDVEKSVVKIRLLQYILVYVLCANID